ncbi:MAG TPA: glycosyltransferase [Chloroflexota bacterium]|jgi:glycosyltransferase involved in cell wall biosynthesis|nr:glycosyltransferase [Chloroflexota bacterium]
MRTVFYLLDGETNASSRHRVLQYLPLLRQHGIEPTVSRPVPERVYQRLVERGSGHLLEKLGYYWLFLACRLRDVLRADRFDVAVVQRDLFPFGPPVLERLLLRRAAALVYDTDDATYLRPSFTPNTPFQRLRRFDKVVDVVQQARWVSVATERIAAWARRYNPRVDLVPMAVDLARYDAVPRPRQPAGEPLVLGWAGTAGGLRYLERLAPVLADMARKHKLLVRVLSGAHARVRLPEVPVDARPWRADSELTDLASFDIGLLPLDDLPFEQAKFPFKLLQYLALGVPTVCAAVGTAADVVRDGENGLLARTEDEWRAQLTRLLDDRALRTRLGQAGRDTAAANYTIERVGPRFADGLLSARRAAALPPRPAGPRH